VSLVVVDSERIASARLVVMAIGIVFVVVSSDGSFGVVLRAKV